jgi:hypothetical protein
LKIGKALGTGTVQRVLMEQPRPFDAAEAAYAYRENRARRLRVTVPRMRERNRNDLGST